MEERKTNSMEERKTNLKRVAEMGAIRPDEGRREKTGSGMRQSSVTPEERHRLIAKAAYLRAASRGFVPGKELEDWFVAEAEIDRIYPRSGYSRSA